MAALVPGLEGSTIMEQMQKLFDPPGGDQAESLEAERHPYFKRPGRGHNHDTCDSCSEGGALICCDSCPASFHFQCHDPPLEDDDIPEGDWICIKCFAGKPELANKVTAAASSSSRSPPGPATDTSADSKKKPQAKKSEKNESAHSAASTDSKGPLVRDRDWRPNKRQQDEEEDRPRRATRNKKQKYNDLSTEDELSEAEFLELQQGSSPSKPSRKTYVDIYLEHIARKPKATTPSLFQSLIAAANIQNAEEFRLPLKISVPEKFPYAWKWSTAERKSRHQAADDSEPRGRSSRLCHVCVRSSRVGPLVQCDFCPCLFHMDCLDPPLAEMPSDVWMCPNHVENFLDSRLLSSTSITERVELWDRFSSQPIDSNAVKLQFMRKCSRKFPMFKRKVRTVASKTRIQVPDYVKQHYATPPAKLPGPAYEGWQDPTLRRHESDPSTAAYLPEELEWVSSLVSLQSAILEEKLEKPAQEKLSTNPTPAAQQEVKADYKVKQKDLESDQICVSPMLRDVVNDKAQDEQKCDVIEPVGEGKKQEVSASAPDASPGSSTISGFSEKAGPDGQLMDLLHEYLATHKEVERLDRVVLQYLAARQISQMLPPRCSELVSPVWARCSLSPVGSRKLPFYMQYRSMEIGVGPGSHMNLKSYGHCNNLAGHHATIFYDELSGQYELINYSQHGTTVDECLYSLDTACVSARFPEKKSLTGGRMPVMAGPGCSGQQACYCHQRHHREEEEEEGGTEGCENSALLHHGSRIKFGCLEFVFAIV